jgi:hypothetical protein
MKLCLRILIRIARLGSGAFHQAEETVLVVLEKAVFFQLGGEDLGICGGVPDFAEEAVDLGFAAAKFNPRRVEKSPFVQFTEVDGK